MEYWMLKSSGNVIYIHKESEGHVQLYRAGQFKFGESVRYAGKPFAEISRQWLNQAIDNETAIPVVPMLGGAWMLESDYINFITL